MTSGRLQTKEVTSTSPIAVSKLRRHLMLWDDSSYDDELRELLAIATEYVGNYIGKPITAITVEYQVVPQRRIQLPHDNVFGLSIKYYDVDDEEQLLSPSLYLLDQTAQYSVLVLKGIPNVSPNYRNPMTIRYSTESETVSKSILRAILVTAAELFEVRTESTDAKERVAAITIDRLLKADKKVVV